MAITLNGTTGITTPDVDSTADISVNGLTVGKGAGNVATNTAVGASSLAANTTGSQNTAVGYQAGYSNTTGDLSVAVGTQALYSNTTGVQNAAVGWKTLYLNTTGNYNNAFGLQALYSNTTGSYNAGFAHYALSANTTGSYNTAVGMQALTSNTTASYNTAVGYQAGYTNTTGQYNTFVGIGAGYTSNTTGNTFVGRNAGTAATGAYNSFIGMDSGAAITTGAKNTIIGRYDGNTGGLDIRTASNAIVISDGDGNPRIVIDGTNSVPAYCKIPYVYDRTTGSGANVTVSAGGILERSTSSLKYKRDVQDTTRGLSDVLNLRAVTYKGKSQKDGDTVFGGLIAEEVHEAGLTEFVQYAADGTPDSLAYGNMVSLCIKAIQELSAKVDAQAAEIAALKGQ